MSKNDHDGLMKPVVVMVGGGDVVGGLGDELEVVDDESVLETREKHKKSTT